MTTGRWEDQIVADYGKGYDVRAIAARYGITVDQVYAVVQSEIGPPVQPPPDYYAAPPVYYEPQPPTAHPPPQPPPGYQYPPPQAYPAPPPGWPGPAPGHLDVDAIVAEYGEGHPVEAIAHRHGLTVQQIYEVVHRDVTQNP
ncbi:helix-turn-helix domain-containing protein [Actinoplanes utahensis]|uniref:Uncharacterized protein n=1 Tax=Actinoplanes utahensis TaxID=1869 RepID=A0A0A6WWE6_ACTUT|nr:helix-turn-helix domain-containing protein [Actinoplanes utahensis]KHD72012.1 hypothetical protein MB27_42625 [Actinoplanes utahensis]GIF31638.1 hypothetical protein Aut01nite_46240 [Actinoplanes utahensis]